MMGKRKSRSLANQTTADIYPTKRIAAYCHFKISDNISSTFAAIVKIAANNLSKSTSYITFPPLLYL